MRGFQHEVDSWLVRVSIGGELYARRPQPDAGADVEVGRDKMEGGEWHGAMEGIREDGDRSHWVCCVGDVVLRCNACVGDCGSCSGDLLESEGVLKCGMQAATLQVCAGGAVCASASGVGRGVIVVWLGWYQCGGGVGIELHSGDLLLAGWGAGSGVC